MQIQASKHRSVDDAKTSALADIRETISTYTDKDNRALEYTAKQDELKRYLTEGGSGTYPFIEAEAIETSQTPQAVANNLQAAIDRWTQTTATISAIWQTAQSQITTSASRSEVREIRDSIIARIVQAGSQ